MTNVASIDDLIGLVMTFIRIGGGLMIVHRLIKLIVEGDERANHIGRIRNIAIFMILAECAHGLLALFHSYLT